MDESYPGRGGPGAGEAELLLARLLPEADVGLLVAALRAEGEGSAPRSAAFPVRRDTELAPEERELHRIRDQLRMGATARAVQHALNNPLTALLAEAQLLELEALTAEQRTSVARIVELARRLVGLTRQMDE